MPVNICPPSDPTALTSALYVTGTSNSGQAGLGYSSYINTPTNFLPTIKWKAVSYGSGHGVGIKSDGTLWGWGSDTNGALGLNSSAVQYSPVQIGTDNDWVKVTCGNICTYAIKSNGTLWVTGFNDMGQLGLGTIGTTVKTLTQVSGFTDVTDVFTGPSAKYVFIKRSVGLQSCGQNTYGQLAKGSGAVGTNSGSFTTITAAGTAEWAQVICGTDAAVAIQTDGTIWSVGRSVNGILGHGSTTVDRSFFQRIGTATDWKSITCGNTSAFAIKVDGTLWAWGTGANGKLGLGNTNAYSSPQKVGLDTDWVSVAASTDASAAVKSDGSLWTWGHNGNGEIGIGSFVSTANTTYWSPKKVTSSLSLTKVEAADTMFYSSIQAGDGTFALYSWGAGNSGRMGAPTLRATGFNRIPQFTARDVVAMGFGNGFTMVVLTDGTLWGTGSTTYNVLQSNHHYIDKFIRIGTDSNWVDVACGTNFVIARKTNGSMWGWGYNAQGQVGNNSTTNVSTPVQIGGTFDYAKIACGGSHALAIKTNGTLWTWGYNYYGQLGKNTADTTNNSVNYTPKQIGTWTDWTHISAGQNHSYGIRGGYLYTCGSNDYGQVARNSTTTTGWNIFAMQFSTPVKGIYGNHASNMTYALGTDDQLYACGQNSSGQLGLGDTTNRLAMTKITSVPVKTASCGQTHSVFIGLDGNVYGMGGGTTGYLPLGVSPSNTVNSPMKLNNYSNWDRCFSSNYGTFLLTK